MPDGYGWKTSPPLTNVCRRLAYTSHDRWLLPSAIPIERFPTSRLTSKAITIEKAMKIFLPAQRVGQMDIYCLAERWGGGLASAPSLVAHTTPTPRPAGRQSGQSTSRTWRDEHHGLTRMVRGQSIDDSSTGMKV